MGAVVGGGGGWWRVARGGALGGLIVGAVTGIVGKRWGWVGLYESIPGFVFGSIGCVVFSLLGKAPSAAMQRRFAEVDAHDPAAPASRLQDS